MNPKKISLPPLYEACPLASDRRPLAAAERAAREGDATGRLYYAERLDRLEAALVLGPDRPLYEALDAAYLLMLGMGEALGAVLPPQVAVHYGWPDRLLVNDGLAGAFCLISPTDDPEAHPDWLVAGLTLDVMGTPEGPEPGLRPGDTSLWEEGISDIGPDQILEAFARHFLSVLNDWEGAGLESLVPRWLGRAKGSDEPAVFLTEEGEVEGRIARVAENGDLVLEVGGREEVLAKSLVLAGLGWRRAGGA